MTRALLLFSIFLGFMLAGSALAAIGIKRRDVDPFRFVFVLGSGARLFWIGLLTLALLGAGCDRHPDSTIRSALGTEPVERVAPVDRIECLPFTANVPGSGRCSFLWCERGTGLFNGGPVLLRCDAPGDGGTRL